jgi:hypothetical protein
VRDYDRGDDQQRNYHVLSPCPYPEPFIGMDAKDPGIFERGVENQTYKPGGVDQRPGEGAATEPRARDVEIRM